MLHRIVGACAVLLCNVLIGAGTTSHQRVHLEPGHSERIGRQRLVRTDRPLAEAGTPTQEQQAVTGVVAVGSHGGQQVLESKDAGAPGNISSLASRPQLVDPYFWFWGNVAKMEVRKSLVEKPRSAKKYNSKEEEDLLDPSFHMPSNEPYNLSLGTHLHSYSRWSQDTMIMPMLEHITDGGRDAFYVESGARDGENGTDTLLYELKGKWSGLLVEPDPRNFDQLMYKHRKAYTFHGCLSPTNKTERVTMYLGPKDWGAAHIEYQGAYKVPAAPLHTLVKALDRKTVDFWSLAVEGSEADILNTTDFKQVEVGVLLVDMSRDPKNNDGVREVMVRHGFRDAGAIKAEKLLWGHIFINPSYFEARKIAPPPSEKVQLSLGRAQHIAYGERGNPT